MISYIHLCVLNEDKTGLLFHLLHISFGHLQIYHHFGQYSVLNSPLCFVVDVHEGRSETLL